MCSFFLIGTSKTLKYFQKTFIYLLFWWILFDYPSLTINLLHYFVSIKSCIPLPSLSVASFVIILVLRQIFAAPFCFDHVKSLYPGVLKIPYIFCINHSNLVSFMLWIWREEVNIVNVWFRRNFPVLYNSIYLSTIGRNKMNRYFDRQV